MPALTIGAVARLSGLRASAIRHYEAVGVLPAPEREHGARRYGPEILDRLRAIAAAQRSGLSLAEIRTVFAGSEAQAAARLRSLAEQHRDRAEGDLARAQRARRWLAAAETCTCADLLTCPLFAG